MLLANVRQFTDLEVVLLFAEHDFTVPVSFRNRPGVSVHVYDRPYDEYLPSVRPYLLWQYLSENPARERETYFYIDSDIIFREWPRLSVVSKKSVLGSDCSGYIALPYLNQCVRGPEIAAKMAEICGVSLADMEGVPGIGAHLVLAAPTATFWQRSYYDSLAIHEYLKTLGDSTNVQKWTAEMWAQFFGWRREGKTLMVSDELDFCLSTDPIHRWDEVKILHNAGVLATQSHEMFFKGQYVNYTPFGRDLSWVSQEKCSYRYVQAIEKVIQLPA